MGGYRRRAGFRRPLEEGVQLRQKVRQDTPVQKRERGFVSLLAGAKAIYPAGTTRRVAPARQAAFGLPGCAEPSVLAETLNVATEAVSRRASSGIARPDGRTSAGPS